MSRKARFTQADVTRAIKGVQSAGGTVTKVTIEPDGTIAVDFEIGDAPREDWLPASNLYQPLGLKRRRK
jgi:hypothetical protein